jgi:hypothetical protein
MENRIEKDGMVMRKNIKGVIRSRISIDEPKAPIDTVIAGILYLL